jgi:hypothetical protein
MDALFHMAPGFQKKTTEVNTRLEAENGQSILIGAWSRRASCRRGRLVPAPR